MHSGVWGPKSNRVISIDPVIWSKTWPEWPYWPFWSISALVPIRCSSKSRNMHVKAELRTQNLLHLILMCFMPLTAPNRNETSYKKWDFVRLLNILYPPSVVELYMLSTECIVAAWPNIRDWVLRMLIYKHFITYIINM